MATVVETHWRKYRGHKVRVKSFVRVYRRHRVRVRDYKRGKGKMMSR